MFQRKKISSAVLVGTAGMVFTGAAVAAIPAVNAVADAMLNVNNFQIRTASGGQIGLGGTFLNGASLLGATTTHIATSDINTVSGLNWKDIVGVTPGLIRDYNNNNPAQGNSTSEQVGIGTSITYFSTIGNIGTWTPTAPYSTNTTSATPLTQFARSQSDSVGNAVIASDNVTVHSTAVLTTTGQSANSGAQQNLSSTFQIAVAQGQTVQLRLSFEGEGYLRAALGQTKFTFPTSNDAIASFSWSASVTGNNGASLSWSPNGSLNAATGVTCNAILTCVEEADAFNMTQTLNQTFEGDQTQNGYVAAANLADTLTGRFSALVTLPTGIYNFSIGHTTQAAVLTPVPVPGTLALLGLGVFALGIHAKRRRS